MISWEALGRAQVPGGGGVMDLFRRGTELSIRVDGRELMSSRVHGSEDALAELACGKVRTRPEARVLIGGLGMGFTLAAALRTLQDDAVVEISELVPEVVAWNRGPIGPVAGHPLEDPRVLVQQRDVGEVIREGEDRYDAIMLDVDNGPHRPHPLRQRLAVRPHRPRRRLAGAAPRRRARRVVCRARPRLHPPPRPRRLPGGGGGGARPRRQGRATAHDLAGAAGGASALTDVPPRPPPG